MRRGIILMIVAMVAITALVPAGRSLAQEASKPAPRKSAVYWSWLFCWPLLWSERNISVVVKLTDEQMKQVDAIYEKIMNTEDTKIQANGGPKNWNAFNTAKEQVKEQCKGILTAEQWALVDKLNTAATEASKTAEGKGHAETVAAVSAKLAELLTPEQKELLAKAKAK